MIQCPLINEETQFVYDDEFPIITTSTKLIDFDVVEMTFTHYPNYCFSLPGIEYNGI